MNYTHINPTFAIHYQRYTAQPTSVTKQACSELLIHEEIARAKEPRFVERSISNYFTPIDHHEMFAPIEQMKADIREAGGWIAYWEKRNPIAQHLSWEAKFHEDIMQWRATNHSLQSALGFEPTDSSELHHALPPFIAKPKPQVCIDFGFEPTEGCE